MKFTSWQTRGLTRNLVCLSIALSIASLLFGEFLLEEYMGFFLSSTEAKTVDLRFRLRGPRKPSGDVVIVAIDSKSIENLGRWPWSRTTHVALIDQLRAWGASALAFDVLFTEEEGVREAARLHRVIQQLPSGSNGEERKLVATMRQSLEKALAEAEVDKSFATVLERTYQDDAALTVLAFDFVFEEDLGNMRQLGSVLSPDEELTVLDIASYLSRDENSIVMRQEPPSLALGIRPVITELAEWSAALGYANPVFDKDGALRRERVAVVYSPAVRDAFKEGLATRDVLRNPEARVQAYMPLAVAGVATHLRLSVDKLILDLAGGELRFITGDTPEAQLSYRFDRYDGTAFIDFAGSTGSFATYSFVDVLENELTDADGNPISGGDAFAGKLVFIGTTDHGLGDFFVTPFTARLPGVEKHANVAENILTAHNLRTHSDPTLAVGLTAAVAAILVALIAGNLGTLAASLLIAALGGGWVTYTYFDFIHDGLIWNWTVPLLTVVLSYAGVVGYRSASERRAKRAMIARSRFIQNTFGRYLSDQVVERLVDNPDALALGGERRRITIMMADLRGFSSLCERSSPDVVVGLLNHYLGAMTEIIFKYGGTIDEFIGDAILALFGAPVQQQDDASRAIACAIEMQLAMDKVNEFLRGHELPEVEMGIALNTGEVIVGNIGSERRAKYGIVGTNVNLTGRIESLTVGGQVFVSESTLHDAGEKVATRSSQEIRAKGFSAPIRVHEVLGIGAPYNLELPERLEPLVQLTPPIKVQFNVLEGKEVTAVFLFGQLVSANLSAAEMTCDEPLPVMMNLRMVLQDEHGDFIGEDLYAKVVDRPLQHGTCALAFTSVPPEVRRFISARLSMQE